MIMFYFTLSCSFRLTLVLRIAIHYIPTVYLTDRFVVVLVNDAPRQHASPLEARPPVSNLPRRLPGSRHLPLVESRSPTVTVLEPLHSVRSVGTRSRRTSSSESSPSSVWFVRLPKISRVIFDSKGLPSWPSRRQPRLIWSDSSRTLTCVLSTPSV
jgi:hypothetical protein